MAPASRQAEAITGEPNQFCSSCHEKFGTHEERVRSYQGHYHTECARYEGIPVSNTPRG